MKKYKKYKTGNFLAAFCAVGALFSSVDANALTIVDGNRTASLDIATASASGEGNSQESDINAEFPAGDPWTLRGDNSSLTGGVGTQGLLTIGLTSGTWGSKDLSGTWTLASDFWSNYGSAVIAIHAGGSPQPPADHFSFLIKKNELSGTWSYQQTGTGGGGGISNLRLFSSGKPSQNVPEGGATIALMGLALGGIAVGRRFFTRA